jgi:hypothetical protein
VNFKKKSLEPISLLINQERTVAGSSIVCHVTVTVTHCFSISAAYDSHKIKLHDRDNIVAKP